MLKKFSIICLSNFFIASVLGLLLRYASIDALGINYRYFTHAHSHVAMLGWVYLMLYTFIVFNFTRQNRKKYIRLFWITQISVLGMLFSFPFQGYGTVSIAFSTLHILCSYFFVFWVWKDLKNKTGASVLMLKSALVFMLISTIGVWSLGPIIAIYGDGTPYYDIAIQFFLHFQFNGWFLFGVLALLIKELNIKNSTLFKSFYLLLTFATIATIALPIYWYQPSIVLFYLNGLGVFLQLIAVLILFRLIYLHIKKSKPTWSSLSIFTYAFVLSCIGFKVLTQGLSLIPGLVEELYQYRNFIIGYIHLVMLGIITGLLLVSLLQSFQFQKSKILQSGFYLFYFGFITTEILIFYQALGYYLKNQGMNHYHRLLFWASTFLALGILCILIGTFTSSYKEKI
ncbi:MAG: hypothetical protein KDD05_05810 [Psychroserpens sp.]|nr:hypothetical protein [Psychroserpens sp.]